MSGANSNWIHARPETVANMLQIIQQERPMSLRQLYRLISSLGLRRIGQARQSPAYYPPGSALKILVHLGFLERNKSERIVSIRELRKERAKAQKGAR